MKYEKEEQPPEYLTRDEIERLLAAGSLDEGAVEKLWKRLILRVEEVHECLELVRKAEALPFVYPMFVFVAHTGARRSEMMRSRVEDFDFDRGKVTVREKKKNKKFKETTRAVDMSPLLREVMRDWLGRHPASPFTFCQTEVVGRSKKRSKTTGHKSGPDRPTTLGGRAAGIRAREDRPTIGPLTKDEANHHFHKALAGTRWAVIRGFHTFRHSLSSNLGSIWASDKYIDS